MRFDIPIYFQSVKKGDYDKLTGNYAENTVTEVKKYASVTDSSTITMQLVYGEPKQGSKTIRLLRHYNEPFSHIRIGEQIYKVDKSRKLRTKQVFIVSEVQADAAN